MTDKPPLPVVRKGYDGLFAANSYFAELLDQYPVGTEFDLKPRTKRSVPHNAMYWGILRNVVKATGRWANEELLNRDIKDALGYWEWQVNEINGQKYKVFASKDFDKMRQDEFNEFFEQAMALLAEELGVDPMEMENNA